MSADPPKSFSGRARRKQTRLSVRLADIIAGRLITIGGIGTIVAVMLVFVYLLAVVRPLFQSAETSNEQRQVWPADSRKLIHAGIDEQRTLLWNLYDDGTLEAIHLASGKHVDEQHLSLPEKITAASFPLGSSEALLGLADGTIALGKIDFDVVYRDNKDLPAELHKLPVGETAVIDKGVGLRTPPGQVRIATLAFEFGAPIKLGEAAVTQLDHMPHDQSDSTAMASDRKFIALSADGKLRYGKLAQKENEISGEVDYSVNAALVPLPIGAGANVKALYLLGLGDGACLAWSDGRAARFNLRSNPPRLSESLRMTPEGVRLSACMQLLGRETIVCGDERGGLVAWFRVRQPNPSQDARFAVAGGAAPIEELRLLADDVSVNLKPIHRLAEPDGAAVTALSPSQRSRMLAAGFADGELRLYHVTTERSMLAADIGHGSPLDVVVIAPKDNALLARAGGELWQADLDSKHPEASFASLFRPVWYEGYSEPKSIWQSSFSGVAPEMKLGMWPLVIGTLKATFYTMLFAVPIALAAAIYTSEFLKPKLRARVKPVIEMMASLPSVVLGFLASVVFAPVVVTIVPQILAAFVTVPGVYLIAVSLWLLLPEQVMLRWERYRFWILCALLPLGILASIPLGRLAEQTLFSGSIMSWLDGGRGSGTAGWLMLMLPASWALMFAVATTVINPAMRRVSTDYSREKFAALNFLKVVVLAAGGFALALALSWILSLAGLDPRGTYVGTYNQLNALIVGVVMGFAVIPIIYTLADDALMSVPPHLRSASLGCGATPWQTTVRVVIPTAMSGLFSAVMVGLGRAVGETMIVLMAGGNTPITDWNIFSGFKTLSVNIAVELPEAVPGSTHYRTLFLAGLTLFLLTFLVNTVAEVVRQRFRRRAFQL